MLHFESQEHRDIPHLVFSRRLAPKRHNVPPIAESGYRRVNSAKDGRVSARAAARTPRQTAGILHHNALSLPLHPALAAFVLGCSLSLRK